MLKSAIIKIAIVLCVFIFVTACQQQKDSKTIYIGVSGEMPPYSYYDPDSNELVGFDVELARELAKVMNKKLNLETYSFNRLIAAVSGNQIDVGMGSMNIVPARQEVVNFSIPYNYSRGQFVVQASNKDVNSIDDIREKKIMVGIRNGTVYPGILINELGFSTDQLKKFPTQRDLRIALQLGMVGSAVSDYAAMYHLKNNEGFKIKFVGTPVNETPCGLTVNKKNKELLEQINLALQELIDNGIYDRVSRKWFGLNPLIEKPSF
jgi:polar amino acid transport system substrate-binding protein